MFSRSERRSRPPIQLRSIRWWFNGLWRVAAAVLLVAVPLMWFTANYRVGIDVIEGESCLPYTLYLVDLNDQDVTLGDYVAFEARQMEPFYADGTTAVKIIAAVPGDQVTVDESGVAVNGKIWGAMAHVGPDGRLSEIGKTLNDYRRNEIVPEGRFLMLATHERSYDSRYWGTIAEEQVIGRVIPLF